MLIVLVKFQDDLLKSRINIYLSVEKWSLYNTEIFHQLKDQSRNIEIDMIITIILQIFLQLIIFY